MSLAEIEAELKNLTPDELRRLAIKSWDSFVKQEETPAYGANQCDEQDPRLLAALDEAIAQADAAPDQGFSGTQVRTRLNQWISK